MDELKGEMKNIKPPMFDGEHRKEEDAETWLLGMRKYFQLQNYSSHVEGRIGMYHLNYFVIRNHHHSQGRSKKKTHSSSSPYPTIKHRISGVDELKGEMNNIKPPKFDGEH